MGQIDSYQKLKKLPPKREEVETLDILRQLSKSSTALGELKGIAKTIPNQAMLINAVALLEAKDSSEIENCNQHLSIPPFLVLFYYYKSIYLYNHKKLINVSLTNIRAKHVGNHIEEPMKPLMLLTIILTLSCNSKKNQIQVFEDTLGIEETKALNVLVSDFEINLSNIYPNLSPQNAYLQYITDLLSLNNTSYEKFNFQSKKTKSLFKKSGLWNEVHRIDTTMAGYQVNVNGKYMRALENIKESDTLVNRYYKSRKKDGIIQDRIDAILNSKPNFDNYIHKRIVVLEFGY